MPNARPDLQSTVSFVETLLEAESVESLKQRYLDGIDRVVGASCFGIYVFDPWNQQVRHSGSRGVSDYFMARYEEVGRPNDPLLAHVIEHRGPADSARLMTADEWRSSRVYDEVMHLHRFSRVIETPVLADGAVVGTLNFGTQADQPPVSELEVELAGGLGRLLGAALAGLRARELTARERDGAQAALELCSEPLVVTDMRTGSRRVNSALRELSGRLEADGGLAWIDDLMAEQRQVGDQKFASARVSLIDGADATLRIYSAESDDDPSTVISVLRLGEGDRPRQPPQVVLENLTRREREIADLITEGLRNAEIADRLYLSPHTVKQYVKAIYRKVGVGSRVQLTRLMLDGPGETEERE